MKLINWLQSHKKPLQPQEEKVLKSDEIFLDTIESLKETIRIQNETIAKLSAIQQFVVETKTQYVPNPIDEELKEKIQQLNEERRQLREQLNLATDLGEIERIKGAYQSLLAFTFQNLRQQTDIDPAHAKNYWENLVK
jgi:hypothetical protein